MAKGKKTNKFKKKADKENLLKKVTHGLDTKGNVKNTALETGRDIIVGVIGGGLIGAAIGKPSLYIGAGVTGAGHYAGNRTISLLGIGMMAANGFQKSKSVEGLNGMDMQSIKERMNAYRENFMEKTYLDHVMHKAAGSEKTGKGNDSGKATKQDTSGFGAVQFFTYPNDGGYEFPALDQVHNDVQQSGMAHMQENGVPGADEENADDRNADSSNISFADVVEYNL